MLTRKVIKADHGFTHTLNDDGSFHYVIKPSGLSFGQWIIVPISFLLLLVTTIELFGLTVALLVLAISSFAVVQKFLPQTFDLTDDSITVRGKTYELASIGEVYISHPQEGQIQSAGFIMGGTGAMGVALAATSATVSGLFNISQKVHAKTQYLVGFTYGNKRIKLAKNMTEGSAKALFKHLTAS